MAVMAATTAVAQNVLMMMMVTTMKMMMAKMDTAMNTSSMKTISNMIDMKSMHGTASTITRAL
eukprot:10989943-Alexandrium_andersonii.AAC.1